MPRRRGDQAADRVLLARDRRDQLLTAMDLDTATLRALARPRAVLSGVRAADTAEQIRRAARDSGHLPLLVWDGGVVHVATR